MQDPRIHIFVYSWNKCDELRETLTCLKNTDWNNYKVFILNNGSTDGTSALLHSLPKDYFKEFKIIELPVNIGAAPARNWLLADPETKYADYIAYLDDDVEFKPNWLRGLYQGLISVPNAGVIGAKIIDEGLPKTIQHSGGLLLKGGTDWIDHIALWGSVPDSGQFDCISERDYIMGCCNLYTRKSLEDVGDFDVQFSPSQFDDVDHHLRYRLKGYKVLFHGGVEVEHKRKSGGPKNANHVANRYKLMEKYAQGQADQILAQGALNDFIPKHPWVK